MLAKYAQVGYIWGMIQRTDSEIILMEPNFTIGDIVIHTLYHFRAAVVDVQNRMDDTKIINAMGTDMHAHADQLWYKLLIDDGDDLSYAPESLLYLDTSYDPIHHPMLERYLTINMEQGRYTANALHH